MSERILRFRNARNIILRSDLEEILAEAQSPGGGMEILAGALQEGVREGFILIDARPGEGRALKTLAKALKDAGVRPSFLEYKRIQENDFAYYRKTNAYIRRRLLSDPCLFLYAERDKDLVESYLPTILVSAKRPELSPDNAMALLHGDPAARERGRVDGFLKYLAARQAAEVRGDAVKPVAFARSRFSIRVKLLGITSGIIAVALAASILFATVLFRGSSVTLIQGYNLSLARLIGQRVEKQIDEITYRSQALVLGKDGEDAQNFFKRNPMILSVALIPTEGGRVLRSFSNTLAINSLKMDPSALENSSSAREESAEGSGILIRNVSDKLKSPVLAIKIPLEARPGSAMVVHYLASDLLRSFQDARQTTIFQMLIVDRGGSLLVHSDETQTLQPRDMRDVPIVKQLLESVLDNGSSKYSYQGTAFLGSFYVMRGTGLGVAAFVPAESAFATATKIQRQNILIMVIVLTLAFVVVFFFARTITIPIVNLVAATRKVERGVYDLEIQPETRDEIGLLTTSFLAMARGLRERELIKDAFGKFVNPEIADRALKGELKLGGETRFCTVLFCDLRDFTAMSERLSSDQVVELLNRYFTEMVECITLTGGTVDKFIGDAIMAHWGAILEQEGAERKAVHSALLMRRALLELNEGFQKEGKPSLRFGVGINSGPVVAGQIGSEKRLEYTVIGDTVNLSSRIEYLNKHFGSDILISSGVYDAVKEQFTLARMPAIQVRGKEQAQVVYAVLGWKNDPTTPTTLEELRKILHVDFDAQAAKASVLSSTDHLVDETNNATGS
ncbi:MAG: adenylate/guanylate cyclase domain-containing protein [Spirochaetia bacterium]|nr:adenylate/guanylate cyclase domain-containing protein [Spirochaetia bacterium]